MEMVMAVMITMRRVRVVTWSLRPALASPEVTRATSWSTWVTPRCWWLVVAVCCLLYASAIFGEAMCMRAPADLHDGVVGLVGPGPPPPDLRGRLTHVPYHQLHRVLGVQANHHYHHQQQQQHHHHHHHHNQQQQQQQQQQQSK